MTRRRRPWQADDRGSVAAEFAITVPAVLVVLLVGIAALSTGAHSVRLQDVASDAARLAARGEPDRAREFARAAGAAILIEHHGDIVCAVLESPVRVGPLPALGLTLHGRGCALGAENG